MRFFGRASGMVRAAKHDSTGRKRLASGEVSVPVPRDSVLREKLLTRLRVLVMAA